MALDIVIRNEDDAWAWLKRALDEGPELDAPINLKFEGWPTLDLHFTGHDFNSSVPTRIMPPLLDAQKEIHRLFCQLHYGQQNLRKLTNDDRDRLELIVRVGNGSSNYLTNLGDTLTEVARSAVANMESKHILYSVLAASLIWGSNVAWKNWLDSQAAEKEIDSRVQMSQLEKEKLRLLASAYEKEPFVKELSDGVDEFRNDSLHKLKPSDSFTLPGSNVEIDGKYASEITHKPREQSIEMRIDGEFVIQSVVSGETSGFRIKVKRVIDGKLVNVAIPEGTLSPEQLNILKNNEWAKKPIVMEINAKVLREEITSATLVSASNIQR